MPPYASESWGKEAHDLYMSKMPLRVDGAIIVGAGPSGMATAACLKMQGVPCILLEKADCIGSLWMHKSYDRLHLHVPKQFCELPHMPFPASYPTYPSRQQFLEYLEDYAKKFDIRPQFNESVQSASYDANSAVWRVSTVMKGGKSMYSEEEYTAKYLIVASGENAEVVIPKVPGMRDFQGNLIHSSLYRNGSEYVGKNVLVVGCGNSGMEIALDLANHGSQPSLVVRGPVHVLPREIFGRSTFSIAMKLLRTFPLWFTDWFLVFYTWLVLGNIASYGFKRPKEGPMERKVKLGKTPILDVGTISKVKSGDIKIVPGVESFNAAGARFENGQSEVYDAVVLATGYRSNVPRWLKGEEKFVADNGCAGEAPAKEWKSERGLYSVGFTRKGLLGVSMDAKNVAHDISQVYYSGKESGAACQIDKQAVVVCHCHIERKSVGEFHLDEKSVLEYHLQQQSAVVEWVRLSSASDMTYLS